MQHFVEEDAQQLPRFENGQVFCVDGNLAFQPETVVPFTKMSQHVARKPVDPQNQARDVEFKLDL